MHFLRFFFSLCTFPILVLSSSCFLYSNGGTNDNEVNQSTSTSTLEAFHVTCYTTTLYAKIDDLMDSQFWANELWDFSGDVPVMRKGADEQFDGTGNVVFNPKRMREELLLRLFVYYSKRSKENIKAIVTEAGLSTIERITRNRDLKSLSKDTKEFRKILQEEALMSEEQLVAIFRF